MIASSAPVIVITGMHRSGTSLVASLVTSAGVHLGDRLMGPDVGNVMGHFEDLDFYEVHQRALTANGLGSEGFTCQMSIALPPAVDAAFDALAARRREQGRPWGWKDPRTTLFLDAWRDKIPEATFLLIFRRPWEVVDSLFRRGDQTFALNPRLAVDVWTSYNRRIRDFFLSQRERCLLVETTRVTRDPAGVIAATGRMMGTTLGRPEERYDPTLLVEDECFDHRQLVHEARPEAIEIYETLRQLAGEGQGGPAGVGSAIPRHGALVDAAMMQWVRAARSQRSDPDREVELATLRAQLAAKVRENAALAEKLVRARHKKTLRERVAIESRRVLRRACGLFRVTSPFESAAR